MLGIKPELTACKSNTLSAMVWLLLLWAGVFQVWCKINIIIGWTMLREAGKDLSQSSMWLGLPGICNPQGSRIPIGFRGPETLQFLLSPWSIRNTFSFPLMRFRASFTQTAPEENIYISSWASAKGWTRKRDTLIYWNEQFSWQGHSQLFSASSELPLGSLNHSSHHWARWRLPQLSRLFLNLRSLGPFQNSMWASPFDLSFLTSVEE